MASLDMSLDDVINSRRANFRGVRGLSRPGFGRGRGGPTRGGRTFGAFPRNLLGWLYSCCPEGKPIYSSIRRTKNLPWQNGLFDDSIKAAGLSVREIGTTLHVSNLDFGVTNEDIRELFSELGELVRYAIHFDKNGRPSGTAEVVFSRRSDAFRALKQYNNVQLDGRPMKLQILGSNTETPVTARVNVVGGANGIRRTLFMPSGAAPVRPRVPFSRPNPTISLRKGRGGGGGSRGGISGRGRGGSRRRGGGTFQGNKTAEELDKELENYHAEAMQS
ncbi:hypothetical protein M569_15180 [Genlisea aurea]|uniref:RRM domain-containing protein n=1 Tax=Genlisea aurea TaxID=192259 RepID=S8C5A1_9LAMI|nr:hypothetical protein M569_15180 [Genlisea aurea]